MRDSMKNPEEAIERVLAGLRDVEAPAGMERRILDRLEERAARRAEMGWRWFGRVWRGVPVGFVVGGIALAGVAVVMLMVPAARRFGHEPVQSRIGVAPVNSVRGVFPTLAAKNVPDSSRGSRVRLKTEDARVFGPIDATDSAADSEDDIALSETRAASFPAPPMPLTEQERLLLRMAQKNDSVELAMLDPRLRELEEAQEKAEFQRFFARPAVKAASGQPTDAATTDSAYDADRLKMDSGAEGTTPQLSEPEKATRDLPMPPAAEQPSAEKAAPVPTTMPQSTETPK